MLTFFYDFAFAQIFSISDKLFSYQARITQLNTFTIVQYSFTLLLYFFKPSVVQ